MYVDQTKAIISFTWNLCLTCRKATKIGAIVGGQTSCKAPELNAFDKHLPEDVEIISCHSLHGPKVNPNGQPLVWLPVLDAEGSCNNQPVLGVDPTSGVR